MLVAYLQGWIGRLWIKTYLENMLFVTFSEGLFQLAIPSTVYDSVCFPHLHG